MLRQLSSTRLSSACLCLTSTGVSDPRDERIIRALLGISCPTKPDVPRFEKKNKNKRLLIERHFDSVSHCTYVRTISKNKSRRTNRMRSPNAIFRDSSNKLCVRFVSSTENDWKWHLQRTTDKTSECFVYSVQKTAPEPDVSARHWSHVPRVGTKSTGSTTST